MALDKFELLAHLSRLPATRDTPTANQVWQDAMFGTSFVFIKQQNPKIFPPQFNTRYVISIAILNGAEQKLFDALVSKIGPPYLVNVKQAEQLVDVAWPAAPIDRMWQKGWFA